MGAGVVQVERLLATGDPTDEPFVKPQPKLADFGLIQAFGGPEYQLLTGFVMQIDRTDIGVHGRFHLGDDQAQSVLQRIGIVDVLNQAPQYLKHYRLLRRRRALRGFGTRRGDN